MGSYGQTDIHPVALLITLGACALIFFGRRHHAVLGFLIIACLITHAQRVVVAGLDFSMLRIAILVGWARVVSRGETASYRFQTVDALLPIWLGMTLLAYGLGPRGQVGGYFVQHLGTSLDAAGSYFLFRLLLRDVVDVRRALTAFGTMALVVVGPMLLENLTGRNLFAFLGGVPDTTTVRAGRLRCQASFSHPIMAGNFGASTAAMMIGMVLAYPKERAFFGTALVAAVAVTILSSSSGPALALLGCLLGWSMWPFRAYFTQFRWAVVALLFVIHFVREQPVWHLIGRISSITGGTGWHRVALINAFIRHFDEWWWLGTLRTDHWKQAQGNDLTNQYIIEGVRGGLPGLIAFVAMLWASFRIVGRARRFIKSRRIDTPPVRRRLEILTWSVGACLAVHAIAFIGVSYFGQLLSIFYMHVAMIPAMMCALERRAAQEDRERRRAEARGEAKTGEPPQARPLPPVSTAELLGLK